MVQTKQGAGDNPWIAYMQACAANYHAGQALVHDAPGKPDKPSRRVTGKQAPKDSHAHAKAPAKNFTEKDTKKVEKAVKEGQKAKQRKAKAKK